MADITRNMFYWFRGPRSGKDLLSHRQLENNVTKSFITVLEHCDREALLKAFLKRLGLQLSKDVIFTLQRKPVLAGATKQRVVVGITGGPAQAIPSRSRAEAGRPDAWICGSTWTVLVESKIGAKITLGQLHSHARAAGWQRGSYRTYHVAWHELHRLCNAAKAKIPGKDRVSHLLLNDWLSYMEYQNMTEFEKLEPVDFDFFALPADERRALVPHMRRRIHAFAGLLSGHPPAKKIARLFQERSVEKWKFGDPSATGRGCWFNIGGEPSPRTWHATVFYRPYGMGVTVLNSGNHLARKLCKAGVDGFRRMIDIASQAEGVYVGCRRAWYRDPESPYKGRAISRTDEPILVEAHSLDAASRDSFALLLKSTMEALLAGKKWRTELHVRQDVLRDQILRLSATKQVMLIGRAAGNLLPILKHLLSK